MFYVKNIYNSNQINKDGEILMKIPEKINLANLPTPILPLSYMKNELKDTEIYIKRDDFSGLETSGNKIRKLEFSLKEAIDRGSTTIITCGGIQSNHCRTTASVCASLGLKCHLVLRGTGNSIDGNLFLDKLFCAEITFINEHDYTYKRNELMESIKNKYESNDEKAYIIPEGASNGIGMFGYYNAFLEILEQEKNLGLEFNTICIAEGSGGTYAGLYAANEILNKNKKIVGFNIYNKNADVRSEIKNIIVEGMQIASSDHEMNYDNILINSDYAFEGYGICSKENIDFIKKFAAKTGIALDPVYMGKAMYGLFSEIKKENPLFLKNILIIHTGGLFGLFPQKELFF